MFKVNHAYLSFYRFLKPHRHLIVIIVLLAIVQSILATTTLLILPELMFKIDPSYVNKSLGGQTSWFDFLGQFKLWLYSYTEGLEPFKAIVKMALIVALLYFVKNIIDYSRKLLTEWFEVKTVTDMRAAIFKHIQHLPIAEQNEKSMGHLLSLMTGDSMMVFITMKRVFEVLILQPMLIVTLLSSILFINYKISLVILFLIPVSAFALSLIGKSLARRSQKVAVQNDAFVSLMTESFTGARLFKSFNAENFQFNRFFSQLLHLRKLQFSQSAIRSLNEPISEIIGGSVVVGVIILGAYLVKTENNLSGADIITILTGLLLIIDPVKKISDTFNEFKIGMVSVERLTNLLKLSRDEDLYGKTAKSSFEQEIHFSINEFKYSKDSNFALKDIQFTVKKGQTVALVGASGSGKSTLADLLNRFYKVEKGSIKIDSTDINLIDNSDLRKLICIVPQLGFMLNESVAINIQLNQESASKTEIESAAQAAYATDFINNMESGFTSSVGDNGNRLSGGQKQRISIARAILRHAPILILDEATSALDSESEKFVLAAFSELRKEHTMIVIAHRLSTIKDADLIIVMNQGQIVERGTHNELLKLNAYYKKLCDIQNLDQN